MPSGVTAGSAPIVVYSTSVGQTAVHSPYTYLEPGAIVSVSPPIGSAAGGETVTITGSQLGSGSDITGA